MTGWYLFWTRHFSEELNLDIPRLKIIGKIYEINMVQCFV